jgi:hypothetical protein
MHAPEMAIINAAPSRRACLVEGCTCKDARIVSTRRAAYFATVAIERGETANRVVGAEPAWPLPASPDIQLHEGAV